MNKKLRLLVTAKCHNKCPMCCNNQFDFEEIPVVDRLDYDEISIMFQVVFASTRPVCIYTPCFTLMEQALSVFFNVNYI